MSSIGFVPDFAGAGAPGKVPDPVTATGKFLRDDGTFATPAGSGVTSVTATAPVASSGGTTPAISISDFVASGASHARGTVPDPGSSAGTTHYLREDATWAVPPSSSGTVTSVSGTAPVSVTSPTTTPAISVATFVASGVSHATGLVPDPGASGGTTHFLREDASWAVPPGSSGVSVTTKGDLQGYDSAANRIPIGSDNQFLRALASQALGLKWDTLAASDIPSLAASKITSGQVAAAQGGTGIDTSGASKGDVLVNTGSVWARLGVGGNGQVLTADSAQTDGVKWGSPGAGSGGALTQIALTILGSNQATVSFTSIPGSYTNLLLIITGRTSSASEANIIGAFNSDTAAHYNWVGNRVISGGQSDYSSGTVAGGSSSATVGEGIPASGAAAGEAGSTEILIPFYAGTTFWKQWLSKNYRGSGSGIIATFLAGNWASTAAITQIDLTLTNGNWLTGSSFALYGMA